MSAHARTAFAVQLAIEYLAREFTRCTFCTFTFHENITVKREAAERWEPLKKRLKRKFKSLMGVGVWQRQKRGAWHLHMVMSQRVAIEWLRAAAMDCGFGSFINIKYVDSSDKARVHNFKDAKIVGAKDVASYITRYLWRARDSKDKGVRLTEYLGKCRISTVRFSWVGGMSRVWRAGVAAWVELWGCEPSFEGWENVISLGWGSLGRDEREKLMRESRKVFEWQHPERFPF